MRWRPAPPTPTRPRAKRSARFLNAPSVRRNHLRARRHRRHQFRRAELGPRQCRRRATKSSSAIWSTTPISCPGSSSAPQTGAKLRVVPVDDSGQIILEAYREAARTEDEARLASRRSPTRSARSRRWRKWRRWRIAHGACVLVDGAQAVSHMPRGRAGDRLRFLRVLRPQGVRPDRHRRGLRHATQC